MPRGRRVTESILSEIEHRMEQQGELLSDADRETIRQKARDHVAKKKRDKAEADYLAEQIRLEEREQAAPDEAYEDVTIDLAPFVASQRFNAAFISLDGVRFFHGLTYNVRYAVARTLEDIMARGWEHEREIHGERRKDDINRRPVHSRYTANQLINTTTSLRG